MSGPSLNLTAVGYAGNQLDDDFGSVFLTPQFVKIGGSSMKLGEIKPIADGDYDLGYGDVFIQFLANDGSSIADKVFLWNGSKWIYNATKADASEFEIPAGQGVMVDNGVDPEDAYVRFQTAGEVSKADSLLTLDDDFGSVFGGNPFPVGVKLSKFTLEATDDYDLGYGDVFIQFLANDGSSISDKVFLWNGSKWIYNGSKADASEFVVPAGQGVMIDNGVDPDDATVTLRIPAPEL